MIDSKAKDTFWDVVEDCLIEFHGLSRVDAHKGSMNLRGRIESPPSGMSSGIFYHAEPFDVACDIVGKSLDLAEYRRKYDPILTRHNW